MNVLERLVERLARDGGAHFPGRGDIRPRFDPIGSIGAYSHDDGTLVLDARPSTNDLAQILRNAGPINEAILIPRADRSIQEQATTAAQRELRGIGSGDIAAGTAESYLRPEIQPYTADGEKQSRITFTPHDVPPKLAVPNTIRLRKTEQAILKNLREQGSEPILRWYLAPEHGFSADGILSARLRPIERTYGHDPERANMPEHYVTKDIRKLSDVSFTTAEGNRHQLRYGFNPVTAIVTEHKTS